MDLYVFPDLNTGCWLWGGPIITPSWRPIVYVNGKKRLAYRAVYEHLVGPIPDGKLACHKCDTPLCVNPDHIFIGTHADNIWDAKIKGRDGWSRNPEKIRASLAKRKGSEKPNAKINEDVAIKIGLLRGRSTLTEVANKFGVGAHTVLSIWQGRSWRHFTGIPRNLDTFPRVPIESEGRVSEVLNRRADGQTYAEIGAAMGMPMHRAAYLVRRYGPNGNPPTPAQPPPLAESSAPAQQR